MTDRAARLYPSSSWLHRFDANDNAVSQLSTKNVLTDGKSMSWLQPGHAHLGRPPYNTLV